MELKEEENNECTESLPDKGKKKKKIAVSAMAESTIRSSVREYVKVAKNEKPEINVQVSVLLIWAFFCVLLE